MDLNNYECNGQMSLFDFNEKYKIKKPIRLIELFAGVGSQAMALRNIGADFQTYKVVEFDKYAIKSYNAIHGTDFPTLDITKINGSDLEIKDKDKFEYIMTYSFPCGLAGTKIITKNGYKNIEDIKIGDMVLTHNNRYCEVKKTMKRKSNHFYKIKGLGVPRLYLTENHPLYVLRENKEQWIKVKDLTENDYLGFNVNQDEKDVEFSKEYLWLLGRYVADGYMNHNNSVSFAIGNEKEKEFLEKIPKEMVERFKKYQKDCLEYRIADKKLKENCLEFGKGAKNKKVPEWVLELPNDKLQSFFDGYIAGDGHKRIRSHTEQIMFTTVSEELYLCMQRVVAKLYGNICSCYIRKDNRKKTFNDTYNCQFNLTGTHRDQIKLKDKIYTRIKEIERVEKNVFVYNFEVEQDNSYTCQNVNVHNCQDLSLAGKGKGMEKGSGTRSGLLWEVERLLNETEELPQILLMENVTQVHGKKNKEHFDKWVDFLESKGYSNYWQDMNAKEYGIPQNRNRCFMVSILGNYSYEFPKKKQLELRLKDMLEDKVDEKYYINKEWHFTKEYEKKHDENEIAQVDGIKYKATRSITDVNMICRCLDTMGGGQREPKVMVKEATKQGYAIAEQGDSINLEQPNSTTRRGRVGHGVAQTLTTSPQQAILEPIICASRGRNPQNPSSRKPGEHTEQRIEINNSGCSNTLTTVQKDNLVLEPNERFFRQAQETFIENDCSVGDTINAFNKDVNKSGISPTLTTRPEGFKTAIIPVVNDNCSIYSSLRIRKLTPKECWRLMGFKDSDFEKAEKVNSNSQLYKQAGNSIVVNVLEKIFKQLL